MILSIIRAAFELALGFFKLFSPVVKQQIDEHIANVPVSRVEDGQRILASRDKTAVQRYWFRRRNSGRTRAFHDDGLPTAEEADAERGDHTG